MAYNDDFVTPVFVKQRKWLSLNDFQVGKGIEPVDYLVWMRFAPVKVRWSGEATVGWS